MKIQFKLIPIEHLKRGEYQPRKDFDTVTLQDLAQSIRSQGLIEPLIVRETKPNRYEIIAGERRWRAAMLAGLIEVPCMVGDYTNQQAAAVTLIENIQRQDLNLIEEANGYQRLLTEFNFSQDEIATLIGKSRSHIANILRLLNLSLPIQDLLRNKKLSFGHARALLGLTPEQQKLLAKNIQEHEWSVRKAEEEARYYKSGSNEQSVTATILDHRYLEFLKLNG